MNRADFQELTRIRLREAKVLLDNQCYEGAHYLLGYAVECAFKACIAKKTKKYDFPEKQSVIDNYTHDLSKLLKSAGLEQKYQEEASKNSTFELNWTLVKDWSEKKRYVAGVTRAEARDFRTAVVSRKNGILPWLKRWW